MASVVSEITKASEISQRIIDTVSKKSETKILKMEAEVDQNMINSAWASFGYYLSRQLRLGKSIIIPKFGLLTFAAPEFKLDGVTNPDQRDLRLRKPVFIIYKEFVKGKVIKSGITTSFGLRPFSMTGVISGLGQTKLNYTEIAINSGIEKNETKVCIERIFKQISEDVKEGKFVEMEIPNLGKLIIKSGIAAIEFDEFLTRDTLKDATNKLVKEKRIKNGESTLTKGNLELLIKQGYQGQESEERPIQIDEGAQNWLRNQLEIDVNDLKALSRPKTASIRTFKANSIGLQNRQSEREFGREFSLTGKEKRPTTAFGATKEGSRVQITVNPLETALAKIKMWIRSKSLLAEDGFYEIACCSLGPLASLESKLKSEELYAGINKSIGLNLTQEESHALFDHLDKEKSGFITLNNWKKVFEDDSKEKVLFPMKLGAYINYIRDIITKYNLQTDDVLRRMELSKSSAPLNANELAEALKILDPSLDEPKSLKLAKDILKGKDRIDIQELVHILGCPPENLENSDWFVEKMNHIKSSVKDFERLKKDFEKNDPKNEGFIGIADFKLVLMHSNLGLTLNDINRFTRYIPKEGGIKIDYVKFLKNLDEHKTEEEIRMTNNNPKLLKIENIKKIRQAFENYLKENKVLPGHVIRKIYEKKQYNETIKKISTEDFAGFLWIITKNIVSSKQICYELARIIDIDHDGQIDDNDILTYLNRSEDIEKNEKSLSTNIEKSLKTSTGIFPQLNPDEEKVETILRDLRHCLDSKKISFHDFIRMIDINEVGFITFQDLSLGLEKVMKLSQPAKEVLFSYADKLKIGMISHKDFLALLKRSVIDRKYVVTEDNFDWQQNVLEKIKFWVREKNLLPEDSFRIADADFDGYLSKKDLTYFVKDVLKLPSDEVTVSRIDRLFKLMDIFKRGKIQLSDFKKILSDEMYSGKSTIVSGGKELFGKISTDWKIHARQQIGLFLSKNYRTLADSFEEIAQHNVKLIYKHFFEWIEKDQVLTGFNLTERLIQQLFADLDPHKKGYLSQLDWENTFNPYNINDNIHQEILETLYANYSGLEAAFDFFTSNESDENKKRKIITYSGFSFAIQSLIQNRFSKNDLESIWKKYTNNLNYLDEKKFNSLFDTKKFNGSKYFSTLKNKILPDLASTKGLSKTMNSFKKSKDNLTMTKEQVQEKLFEKLRQILFASNTTVEQFFKNIDTDGSGQISNLEFINAIRSMGLGLPLREIEELLIYSDNDKDGKISFQEFVTKFAPRETEAKLFERSKSKLKKVKENIYSYMLSPKDAFLNFNEDRTGKLTYEQFNKMMQKLAVLAREEVPSFSIIRDLFDYIDIRRDGIIDMNEWMNSFKMIENEAVYKSKDLNSKKTKNFNVQSLNKIYTKDTQVHKTEEERPNSSLGVSSWECSKDYERVMKIIGKNRKIISTMFDELKSNGKAITFEVAKNLIGEVLLTNGFRLEDMFWPYLLKFAEKEGIIDHKFLLDVFRDRFYLLSSHPKADTIS